MVRFDALALDCALTAGGRIARVSGADGSVSYRPFVHLRDHLGSIMYPFFGQGVKSKMTL